jgi:hypothetical protein
VKTFKFRETLEFTMGNPEPNPALQKQNKGRKVQNRNRRQKKDRCRDSMEAVLTNGVDNTFLF